jgi:alpha-1,6-mannosyltransferase
MDERAVAITRETGLRRELGREALSSARRLGLTGSLMMAVGSLGGGALPVPQPLQGLRLLGLPDRNPTLSVAVIYTGMALLVIAWWRVARHLSAHAGTVDRRDLIRIALSWAVPLAAAPPLFSRDVYSYLAQGATLARGLDPYQLGPAPALGVDHPLVRSVPALWRDTPSPYGPLFTLISRALIAVTGDDVVAGIFAQRAVALAGLVLVVWALPRLARRAGADPDRAFWLGAAHPLVLFHVVSGAHNDGLMVGLAMVGLEIGLRALDAARPQTRDPRLLIGPLLIGPLLIVAASAVKVPAILALGYFGMVWARRLGGRWVNVAVVGAYLTAVTFAVYLPLTLVVGPRWVTAPAQSTSVLSLMSPPTDVALVIGRVGVLLGFADHTAAVLAILGAVAAAAAAVIVMATLVATMRTDWEPLTLLALGMAAVGVLAAPTQPWYLLWALVPFAATPAKAGVLRVGIAVTLAAALLLPPTGTDFVARGFELVNALAAAVVMLVVVLLVDHKRRPRLPGVRGVHRDG